MAFVYADGGDEWLDEDAPVQATGPTETALVAEANAQELFARRDGGAAVRPVHRAGQRPHARRHRGRAGGHLAQPRPALGVPADRLARRRGGGGGRARSRAPPGIYNVADTDPPTRAEIDAALAAAVGRRSLRPALDEVPPAVEAIARSQRVSSARLREATGWAPTRARRDGRLVAHPRAADRGMTVEQRFAEMRPRLLRLAYSELGDLGEAEDVVQEAWLRLERTGAESVCDLDALADHRRRRAWRWTRCARPGCGARRTSAPGCPSRCCRPSRRRTRPTASRSTSR